MSLRQIIGNVLLTAAIPVSISIAGWLHNDISSMHAAINDHTNKLGTISQNIVDLTVAIRDHNTSTDETLNELRDDDKAHTAAIASAQAQLEDLRREPPRIEREMIEPSQRFTPIPQPLPAIGNAIQHLFSPPHHQWRRRP